MEFVKIELLRYLLDETSVEERRHWEELISKDPELKQSLEMLKETWEQSGYLLELQKLDVNQEWIKFEKIGEKIKPLETPGRGFRTIPMIRWIAAASIFLILSLSIVYYTYSNKTSHMDQFATIEMPSGERGKIILPDGTMVWLNAKSTLTYPVNFNQSKREVTLEGEAYFEVTHRDDQPFRVKVKNLYIEDLGTAFNVSAYSEDKTVETTLFKGKVSLKDVNLKELTTLKPNERVIYSPKGLEKEKFKADIFSTWKTGELIFINEEPVKLFARLTREYDKVFIFHTSDINGKRLTAHFNKGEEFDKILQTIASALELRFETRNNEVSVYNLKPDKN